MTPCPSPERLAAMLSDESVAADDELIEHLGQCEACRHRLQQLSVDGDDWQPWDSILREDRFEWPQHGDSESTATEVMDRSPFDSVDPRLIDTVVVPRQNRGRESDRESGAIRNAASDPTHGVFGDYELIEQIGVGGMGIVFRARQRSADRIVALKLIRPDQLESLHERKRREWLNRFRAEAQAAARLEHENVVTVYDVGEFGGSLYYSMQYIDGESLAQIVRQNPLENRRIARLMYLVAGAVDHAHGQGILHRDLKPQNIIVRDPARERGSAESTVHSSLESTSSRAWEGEQPFVADFGLAKYFEEGRDSATHTGEVIGSPSFMSPEQAQDASRCTPASDVYGLGATLYHALTGRPPFRASSPVETLRQVIDEQPVSPRDLNPAIAADLQTITLKALSKEPSKRYPSAKQMADDLLRYINGEPIQARPVNVLERSARWCRRNPTVALLASGIAALLILVAAVSTLSSIRLRQHAARESTARAEAERYFVMSLDVIHEMLTDYGDESLAHVPHMQTARKELLGKALNLYKDLSEAQPTNPKLHIEFARTQYRIANLYDLLGEPDNAKNAYASAIELFTDLRRQMPHNPQLSLYRSSCHTMLGETLRKTEPEVAMSHFQTALQTQLRLHDAAPYDNRYRRELSRTQNNLGILLMETGQFVLAEEQLSSAIEHLRYLSGWQGHDSMQRASVLADLGRSQINQGVLLRRIPSRAGEAVTAYDNAISNLEQSVELDPGNRDNRLRLAVATVDMGNFYLMHVTEGKQKALRLTNLAVKRLAELREDFPGIPLYGYEHANAMNSSAGALALIGKEDEAMKVYQRAGAILDELESTFPEFTATEAKFDSLKARILGGTGFLHSRSGDWHRARQDVQRAVEYQQSAVDLQPDNPEFVDFLSQHRGFFATVLDQLALPQQAEAMRHAAESDRGRAEAMKGKSTKQQEAGDGG